MTPKRYGTVGWREFSSNRTDILRVYDSAKERSASRPIKTEHGVTGEAAIRQWLTEFLPKKYGVTSGSIIPDVVETPGFRLYYYDVIIFDALNAPILWVDDNPDQSQQGRKRAIPAKYVYCVLEVKASFGVASAKEAFDKLRELNEIASHLPPQSCARSTVAEALKALEDAGILSWVNRIKRVRERCPDLLGDNGWRWRVLRTSNAYNFCDPGSHGSSKSEKPTGTPIQDFSSSKSRGDDLPLTAVRRPFGFHSPTPNFQKSCPVT